VDSEKGRLAGKDFETAQTLMKGIIAPGLKARMLDLEGWYSTNILGNRDGEIFDDEKSLKSKEVTKLSVLNTILQPEKNPELYGDIRTSSRSTTTRTGATQRRAGTT
jgi:myo-inositol-1-phosphate synthase